MKITDAFITVGGLITSYVITPPPDCIRDYSTTWTAFVITAIISKLC